MYRLQTPESIKLTKSRHVSRYWQILYLWLRKSMPDNKLVCCIVKADVYVGKLTHQVLEQNQRNQHRPVLLCHKEGTYVTAEYNTTVQNDSESQCYESVCLLICNAIICDFVRVVLLKIYLPKGKNVPYNERSR